MSALMFDPRRGEISAFCFQDHHGLCSTEDCECECHRAEGETP